MVTSETVRFVIMIRIMVIVIITTITIFLFVVDTCIIIITTSASSSRVAAVIMTLLVMTIITTIMHKHAWSCIRHRGTVPINERIRLLAHFHFQNNTPRTTRVVLLQQRADATLALG